MQVGGSSILSLSQKPERERKWLCIFSPLVNSLPWYPCSKYLESWFFGRVVARLVVFESFAHQKTCYQCHYLEKQRILDPSVFSFSLVILLSLLALLWTLYVSRRKWDMTRLLCAQFSGRDATLVKEDWTRMHKIVYDYYCHYYFFYCIKC